MLGLFALLGAVAGQCPVEHARYTLRHHPDVTAAFHPVDSGAEWPSGLVLAVHDRTSGKTSWWLPWNGGSDALQNVASTEDPTVKGWHPPSPDGGPRPYGDRQFIRTDAAYDIIHGVPERGDAAPAHMLFPDSGGSQDAVFHSRQFFDLVGCSPSAAKP